MSKNQKAVRRQKQKVKRVWTKKNEGGFTLVEVIAASFLLCFAVMMLAAGSIRSLSDTKLNRQYEVAASLIEKQLSLIDYVGIEQFIERGLMEGEFEEYEPVYHWQVITEPRDIDYLYRVRITVSWVERRRPYSVSVDTMLNGRGMLVETEQD